MPIDRSTLLDAILIASEEGDIATTNELAAELERIDNMGFGDALSGGLQRAGGALRNAWNVLTNDPEDIIDQSRISAEIPQTGAQQRFMGNLSERMEESDESVWDAIKNVGGAVMDEPQGAFHELTAQIPNTAAIMAPAAAGAVAGGLAGGPAGAWAGGTAGMALGNVSIETGFRAEELAQDGIMTPEEIDLAGKQGLIKGGFITAVDMLTLKVSSILGGAPSRAMEKAIIGKLTERGVDVTSKRAVQQVLLNPELLSDAVGAATTAMGKTMTALPRAGRLAGQMGLETASEAVGEYGGTELSGQEGSLTEAALEGLMAAPMSIAEIRLAKTVRGEDMGDVSQTLIGPKADAIKGELEQRRLEEQAAQYRMELADELNRLRGTGVNSVDDIDPTKITLPEVSEGTPQPQAAKERARQVHRQTGGMAAGETFVQDGKVVKDSKGRQWGPEFDSEVEARMFAGAMTERGQFIQTENAITDIIDKSGAAKGSGQARALRYVGRKVMGNESPVTYSADEMMIAGSDDLYNHAKAGEETNPNARLSATEAVEKGLKTTEMTPLQQYNARRLKMGLDEQTKFTPEEAKKILKDKYGRLADAMYGPPLTWRASRIDGQPVIVNDMGQVVEYREANAKEAERGDESEPGDGLLFYDFVDAQNEAAERNSRKAGSFVLGMDLFEEKDLSDAEFRAMLDAKNITNDLDSPAMGTLAEKLVGAKARGRVKPSVMSPSEKRVFFQQLRKLPSFPSPTEIPDFSKPNKGAFKKAEASAEPLQLPGPPQRQNDIAKAVRNTLNGYGLEGIKARVMNRLLPVAPGTNGRMYAGETLQDGELVPAELGLETEGYWQPDMKEVFLGIENIASGLPANYTPEQLEQAVINALNHEIIHALRQFDMFTEREWSLLVDAARREVKPGFTPQETGAAATYQQWAKELYGGEQGYSPVTVTEEAVAEMTKDVMSGTKGLGGRPRSLMRRIVEFFKRMFRVGEKLGAETPAEVIEAIRNGEIGSREVGEVRTLTRTEKRQARVIPTAEPDVQEEDLQEEVAEPNDPLFAKRESMPEDQFRKEIDAQWKRKLELMGKTDDPAFEIRVPAYGRAYEKGYLKEINLQKRRLQKVMEKHSNIPHDVVFNLPEYLAKAIKAYRRKKDGGITLVLNASAKNGDPIVVGTNNGRITTIYDFNGEEGETGLQALVRTLKSDAVTVLYSKRGIADLDMTRTARLARAKKLGFDTDTVYYHGTDATQINVFDGDRGVAGHFSPDPEFANDFAPRFSRDGDAAVVYPVYLRKGRIFDIRNPEHLQEMAEFSQEFAEEGRNLIEYPEWNAYSALEKWSEVIRDLGYDSYVDYEEARKPSTGIAIFDAKDIRSVNAAFYPEESDSGDILYSKRSRMDAYRKAEEAKPVSDTVGPTIKNADGSYRRNANGDIAGAPEGVKTHLDIQNIVDNFLEFVEDPLAQMPSSAEWYEQSGKAIRDITHGDPELAEAVVRLTAGLSAENSVGGNITALIKSMYQMAKGEEIVAGRRPNNFRPAAKALMEATEINLDVTGVSTKVMSFYRNLWDATFDSNKYENAITMDRWMARVFGYPSDKLGAAQHRFTNMVFKDFVDQYNKRHNTSYLPRQLQAALWVYARNKQAGVTDVEGVSDRSAFDSYLQRATQNITLEAVPSVDSGKFPEIHGATWQQRKAFTKRAISLILNGQGENELFRRIGIPIYTGAPGAGSFEGAVNPNQIMGVVAEKVKDGNKLVYDTDKVSLAGTVLQYIYTQDGVPWFQLDPTVSGGNRGVAVSLSEAPSQPFMQSFLKHLNRFIPDADFTRMGDYLFLFNFTKLSNRKFVEGVEQAVNTYNGAGADLITGIDSDLKAQGDYLAEDWKDEAQAISRLESRIGDSGSPALLDWARDRRRAVEQLYQDAARDLAAGALYSKRSAEPAVRSSGGSYNGGERGVALNADPAPGASSFDGVHYSHGKHDVLDGTKYGTGIKGAEAYRLKHAADPRLRHRVYFYIPQPDGTYIRKESGLGPHAHTQRFGNILDNTSPASKEIIQRVKEETGLPGNHPDFMNAYESTVLDEGYDGYAVPKMGMMVVFGTSVPVNYVDSDTSGALYSKRWSNPTRTYDPATKAALGKGGFGELAPRETVQARWRNARGRMVTKFRQGMVDQFASFRDILEDPTVWMRAHLAGSGTGALEPAMEAGQLYLHEDGVLAVDFSKKSLRAIFEPLGVELDDFLIWVAAKRMEKLYPKDKEHLFSMPEIKALQKVAEGNTQSGRSRLSLYTEVERELRQWQNSINKVAVDTGLIDEAEAQTWLEEGFYLPFFRVLEADETARGPRSGASLVRQDAIRTLKGSERPLGDLLNNLLMNSSHLLGSSLKNAAGKAALDQAMRQGLANRVPQQAASKKAVWIRENGKKVFYEIDDSRDGSLILDSLVSMNWQGQGGAAMRASQAFKRFLTTSVTASPEFKIRNMIRDTMSAIAVAGMDVNMAKNIVQGWQATDPNGHIKAEMLAAGAIFGDSGYIHGADPEAQRYMIEKVNRGTVLDSRANVKRMWHKWQDWGARLENVNRSANYMQDIASGKSRLEAAFNSRDHLDFARHGAFPFVRTLIQVVPFMNARLQGLDKISRAAVDRNQRAQFWGVFTVYSAASILLYLAMKDDPDYRELEDWQRDTFHNFKIPGSDIMWKIPRPFELGAMANMAERFVEQLVDDEVHGKLFAERLSHTLMATFNFNPTPQIVKPMAEIMTNENWFTGAPIESMSMQRLSPENRKRVWTSATAIKASEAMAATGRGLESVVPIPWDKVVLSPVQMEHLVRGYLGWFGTTALAGIDAMVTRPVTDAPDMPEKRWTEYPVAKAFFQSGPNKYTKYATQFYDNAKALDQIFADISHYRETGEIDKIEQIAAENRDVMRWKAIYNKQKKRLSEINNQMEAVMRNKNLSPTEKRTVLERLTFAKNRLTEQVVRMSGESFR